MNRYLLDGRALQDASSVRGIGTYVRGLLAAMTEVATEDEIGLLLRSGGELPIEMTRNGLADWGGRIPALSRRLQPILDPLLVAAAVRRARPTLYHGVEYGQPLTAPMPVVVTVHDLIPFVFPKQYPWMRRERLPAMRLLRRADAVIADSGSTAADLTSIARVDPRRITVIHPGVASGFRPETEAAARLRERLGLRRPYLLAVGTFDPRKRIDVLTAVVSRVRRHHDVTLVIAGHQGSFGSAVTRAVESAGLTADTVQLGHVSQPDLVALYTAAACLVFTSSYEGFGLPPLEAMACGSPAVVFANSSLPEAVGTAGMIVADGDAAAMADTVIDLLADPAAARRRAAAGREWAARFTWSEAAAGTLDVYRSALG